MFELEEESIRNALGFQALDALKACEDRRLEQALYLLSRVPDTRGAITPVILILDLLAESFKLSDPPRYDALAGLTYKLRERATALDAIKGVGGSF